MGRKLFGVTDVRYSECGSIIVSAIDTTENTITNDEVFNEFECSLRRTGQGVTPSAPYQT